MYATLKALDTECPPPATEAPAAVTLPAEAAPVDPIPTDPVAA